MNIVAGIANVALIAYISYRLWQRDSSALKPIYWYALSLKLVSGIVLGLLYIYYYSGGDTFNYFNDGVKLSNLARQDPSSYIRFLWTGDESFSIWTELIYKQPRAMFLSKVTSIFCILTADSYWVTSLYFSLISFVFSWMLAKKILLLNPNSTFAVAVSFLFFPSVVFWTSGLIKESLAMASLYFLCFVFLKVWLREKLRYPEWVTTTLAAWVLWNLKYYYLGLLLPIVITTWVAQWIFSRMRLKSLFLKIMLWCFIFIAPLLLVTSLHPNFYPQRFLEVVVSSYNEFQAISEPNDVIHYSTLKPTITGFARNVPLAIISGLYRPTFIDADSVLQFLSAAENLILLILTIAALTRAKELINSKHRLLLFSLFIYVLTLSTFLALSTPNFGTLSRFRVGFLPFFVFLIVVANPLVTRLVRAK